MLEVALFGSGRQVGVAVRERLRMLGFEVLNQSSLLIDVKELAAEADGEDGLSRFETVVEDLTVGLLAIGVELGGFRVCGGSIACGSTSAGLPGRINPSKSANCA